MTDQQPPSPLRAGQNFIDTSDCPTPFSGGYWRHAYIAPAQWKGAKWKFTGYACEWKWFANSTKLLEVPNKIKEKYYPSTPNVYGVATESDFTNEDAKAGCRGKRWSFGSPVYKTGHLQAPDWKPIKCIIRFGEVQTLGSASWIRFETPWAAWFNEYIATNAPFLAPALRAPDVQTAISTAQEENIEFEAGSDRESEQVGVEFGADGPELTEPEREATGVLPTDTPENEDAAAVIEGAAAPAGEGLTPLELLQQTLGAAKAMTKVTNEITRKGISVGIPLNPAQAGKQALHNADVVNAAIGSSLSNAYSAAENAVQQGAAAATEAVAKAAEAAKETAAKVASTERFQHMSQEIRKAVNGSPAAQKAFAKYQEMKSTPQFQKVLDQLKN